MSLTEVLVALAIAVGLVGILVPILPGSVLILGGVLVWALDVRGTTAWAVFAVVTTIVADVTEPGEAIAVRALVDPQPAGTLALTS